METTTEINVRYAETDAMGIVYHANYLVYFEVARTDYLEKLGFPYKRIEEEGFLSPVLTCDLSYGAPCAYGDTIVVYTRVTKVTPVRVEYSARIFLKGEDPDTCKPRFTARMTLCVVDKEKFKPVNQRKHFPELYELYQNALEPQWE